MMMMMMTTQAYLVAPERI